MVYALHITPLGWDACVWILVLLIEPTFSFRAFSGQVSLFSFVLLASPPSILLVPISFLKLGVSLVPSPDAYSVRCVWFS